VETDAAVDTESDTTGETDSNDPVDTELIEDTDDTQEPAEDPCLANPIEFEIGTGEDDFTPLTDGMVIEMERGGQVPPGYHIWGGIRANNVPQFVTVAYTLTDVPTGLPLGDFVFDLGLVPLGGGTEWSCAGRQFGLQGVFTDWPAVRDVAMLPDDTAISGVLCGTEVRLDFAISARIADEVVELATASNTIVVQPAPDEAAQCEAPIR
jgi:hypothetical protein